MRFRRIKQLVDFQLIFMRQWVINLKLSVDWTPPFLSVENHRNCYCCNHQSSTKQIEIKRKKRGKRSEFYCNFEIYCDWCISIFSLCRFLLLFKLNIWFNFIFFTLNASFYLIFNHMNTRSGPDFVSCNWNAHD